MPGIFASGIPFFEAHNRYMLEIAMDLLTDDHKFLRFPKEDVWLPDRFSTDSTDKPVADPNVQMPSACFPVL